MKRIWHINGRFLGQPVTGVQRYGREILGALDELITENHPLTCNLDMRLIVPESVQDIPKLRSIAVRRYGGLNGHLWEQIQLPLAVSGGGLISLCSTGPLAVGKQCVCIHDLNTRLIPESFSKGFKAAYRVLIPALGRTAETITTVSHFSAKLLNDYSVSGPAKTFVVFNGHEHALRWNPQHSEKTRAAADRNTIVVFGTGSPNKNVGLLVGMSDELAKSGLRLAVAGATDLRVFAASDGIEAASNILCLGRLTDSELAALLQDSLCLAFPSFVEGFGLPPVEAMALGCPVVVSDSSCLPEICGDAALYASPRDAGQWLQQFLQLRDDADLRATLAAKGRERAKLYSWPASAERYLELMAKSDRALPAPSVGALARPAPCHNA
jgi:glycosyltransferase involved in cell wall biosynthesis